MDTGVLRVVQLNIGSLLEPGWPERRHEVVAWLDRLRPDVVCLQEAWEDAATPNTAGWVAEHLADADRWHWHFGGGPFGQPLWPDPGLHFGSAVLSRWPIEGATYHRLPTGEAAEPDVAAVPWELLHVRTAGLDLFSCHLVAPPRATDHRQIQVRAIDEIIRRVRGHLDTLPPMGEPRPGMPVVLCGDFNAEPDSDEIRFLCGLTDLDGATTFFQDAWRVAGSGTGLTQDWRANPIADGMNIHRKRIDYVFVGDPFRRAGSAGRVLAAEVAFHEPLTGIVASDHAGVVVDVVWPDRPR